MAPLGPISTAVLCRSSAVALNNGTREHVSANFLCHKGKRVDDVSR